MSRCRLLFLTFFISSLSAYAQQKPQLHAGEIKLGLQKLANTGSVLYIAAHPDDENTRLLAYLAKERKFRTGYLSLTRGDGGQNLIGTEQAELLGVIRTQELLAARKVDGAEQFFTRANDFGFSKTSDESLKFWGKERILEDMVWVIRKFKPDVIITRFPEDARAGHGQHAASAILAREAFIAAADANRFPSQLQQLKTWQAKRIVWNTFNFNAANNTTSPDQLKIDVGAYNPLLGKSYGEIAAESRTNHKSQGFGSASQRGELTEFFSHVAGREAKTDLFEDIDQTWVKYPKGEEISRLINETEKAFDMFEPWKSVESLLQIKRPIDQTGNQIKSEEVDALILACAGIWLEVNSPEPAYAIGESIPVKIQAISRVSSSFTPKITISEALSSQQLILQPNKLATLSTHIQFKNKVTSQPFWLNSEHSMGSYVIAESEIGLPENKTPFSAILTIRVGDQEVRAIQPLVYKYTDPVRGEVYQYVSVAPPVTASLTDKSYIFKGTESKKVQVQLQNFKDKASGTLQLAVPAGWKVAPQSIDFTFEKKGSVQNREFMVTPDARATAGNLSVSIKSGNEVFNQSFKEIKYDHIPAQALFPRSVSRLEKLDLKTAGLNIAYLPGAGDLISESLKQVGYRITSLSTEQVLSSDLSVFDAIITGIRLYNVNEQAQLMQPKLLDYISKGGVLLVQYNVNSQLRTSNIGPYPFALSRDRVTEEDATVTILKPEHRVFNYPNKITSNDFKGWVQERGLYFATEIDKHYTPLLSMNDQGEKANAGALLVAEYGKGRFVYTSLSFFRQLPSGVPGAYRLFVNLLSK